MWQSEGEEFPGDVQTQVYSEALQEQWQGRYHDHCISTSRGNEGAINPHMEGAYQKDRDSCIY
jgi:hypothetical protein